MVDRWLARKAITKRGDVIHSHYGQPDAEEFDVPTFFNHRTITEEFNLQTTVVKLVCANGEVIVVLLCAAIAAWLATNLPTRTYFLVPR